MITKQRAGRREAATAELQARKTKQNARQIVDGLSVGLSHLRDLLMVLRSRRCAAGVRSRPQRRDFPYQHAATIASRQV